MKMSCRKCWRWHFQDPKLKIFCGSMPPEPPRLDHLLHYNFSSPCEHIFKISCYTPALWFNPRAILLFSQIHNLILLRPIYIYWVIVCHVKCWCKPKQSALDSYSIGKFYQCIHAPTRYCKLPLISPGHIQVRKGFWMGL